MEVTKPWSDYDINKYYIITRDKETNEWKFFKEIVRHTVIWKDEPSRYGMTKSRAIEVLNIVKNLTNKDVEPETPTNPTEDNGESGTNPSEPTTPTDTEPDTNTDPTDTPTEPSESDNSTSTNTDGETPTEENNNGETSSEGDTEPITEPEIPTDPVEPTVPTDPTTPVEEPQYKIITISSVTYNSTEAPIFDDDYNKLKSTLIYIDTTYPNNKVNVVTAESDTGKSIFYFYLEDELTWFLELRTNIDYSLVNHVTTLDDIRELL